MFNAIAARAFAMNFDNEYVTGYPFKFGSSADEIGTVIKKAANDKMRVFVVVAFSQDLPHLVNAMKENGLLLGDANTLLIWDASVSLAVLRSLPASLKPFIAGSVLIYGNYM